MGRGIHEAGLVVHTCDPSPQKAEAGGLPRRTAVLKVRGYIVTSCLESKRGKKSTKKKLWIKAWPVGGQTQSDWKSGSDDGFRNQLEGAERGECQAGPSFPHCDGKELSL